MGCSVRVGNELGSKHPKSAAFSVVVVTVVAFIISVFCSVIVLAFRNVIGYAFTEGLVVAAAVSDLCPLLALTILLNGIQPVLSGTVIFTHLLSVSTKIYVLSKQRITTSTDIKRIVYILLEKIIQNNTEE